VLGELLRCSSRVIVPSLRPVAREISAAAEPGSDNARGAGAGMSREREIRLGAEDYVDEILNTFEVNLSKLIAAVKRGRERLHGPTEPTVGDTPSRRSGG
jgi:hypothetical protein